MALRKLLDSPPDSPYAKLPPIHIIFLKIEDSPRVVAWNFEESCASPTCIKNNKTAVISDGHSLTKITLFEAVSGRVAEGGAYFMKGHTLLGRSPPFTINVGSGTQFFQGSKIDCPAELHSRAEALLHPASPLVELRNCWAQQGLMSLEGVVVELSAVRKVESGKEAVPLRKLVLQQDTTTIKLSLWREAAVEPIIVGETIKLTHVKSLRTEYGIQVNTTNFTKVEKQQSSQTLDIIGVLKEGGATSTSNPPDAVFEVLLQSGETMYIEEALWEAPFDDAISQGPLKVEASVTGKTITAIKIK
ncbi:hypothetical protein KUCAC02_037001 [Xyrichtys novacula]|uniref:Uncharacterized protein n=1 Tax=Xyrichtys novacula TaxID=13765 RepID=A0AAV1F9Q2_XYRNO|nr:hypothetical protein KUCAC02_037001 [Xyrichtys novacula]